MRHTPRGTSSVVATLSRPHVLSQGNYNRYRRAFVTLPHASRSASQVNVSPFRRKACNSPHGTSLFLVGRLTVATRGLGQGRAARRLKEH
ncbi:hypothetical protein L1887_55566 [Cichorium endivia]|nr:hypothetical protein L1887_55566 [Cichorium endivia]